MIEKKTCSHDRNTYTFPLIVSKKESLFNIHDKFLKKIQILYKVNEISAQEIFNYIYSILHSPAYRGKYSEFLKNDFPKIPFTEDKKLFKQLAELGNELIQAHLLQNKDSFDSSLGHYFGKNHIVEKQEYRIVEKTGRLFINKESYFDNVPREVYEFYIGGYQVLDKYLKERKGRNILHESEHVEDIIKAVVFTINQMKKIDSLTTKWI